MKTITVYLLLLLPIFSFSQKYTIQEIDSLLLNENHKLNTEAKYNEAILLNKKLIEESKKLNYDKGVARGYLYIGSLLSTIGKHKESIEYLGKARKKATEVGNNFLLASILLEYARNYEESGLHRQAIATSKKAEKMAASINSRYDRESIQLYSYSSLMSSYYSLNLTDSAYYYVVKSYKIEMSAYNLSAMAYHHLNFTPHKDSAKYYLERTRKVLTNQPTLVFERALMENLWGDLYMSEKKYKDALDHYNQSIPFAVKSEATVEITKAYKGISNAYEFLGDFKKSKEYLAKYTTYQDSIEKKEQKIIDATVQMVIDEKEEAVAESRKHLMLGLFIIVLLASGAIYILVKLNKNEQKKFNKILYEEHSEMTKTVEESHKLKQQVNPFFYEIVELAKKDSPEFAIRFKEVYPNFCKELRKINPDLTASDLRFCALLSLNFLQRTLLSILLYHQDPFNQENIG